MNPKETSRFCFMIRSGQPCVKTKVDKKHLPYYECERCVWRIKSEEPRHLKSLQRIYEKYGDKTWNI